MIVSVDCLRCSNAFERQTVVKPTFIYTSTTGRGYAHPPLGMAHLLFLQKWKQKYTLQ